MTASEYDKLYKDDIPLAQTKSPGQRRNRRRRCCCLISIMLTAVVVALCMVGIHQIGVLTYPLHAQCSIEWKFDIPCAQVAQRLQDQIEKWKTDDTCGTGQKCLYKFVSYDGKELKATHETPVKHYMDDLTFTFKTDPPTSPTCELKAYSRSRIWYAVLDYGTNYCNLRNLADGAGLTSDPKKFTEQTSNSVCTQYSSRNCEKY